MQFHWYVYMKKKSLLRSITQYVYMYHISNKYYIVKELLIQYITSVEDFISLITYECQWCHATSDVCFSDQSKISMQSNLLIFFDDLIVTSENGITEAVAGHEVRNDVKRGWSFGKQWRQGHG